MPDAPAANGATAGPELPPEPDQRLAPRALVAWMIAGAGWGAGAIALALVASGGQGTALTVLALVAALAVAFATTVALPVLRHRTWRYAVREDEIDLVRGAWVVRRTIVPMARVQHVDTTRTPLGQMFEIATLTIHTAAGRHEIPGLTLAEADRLRTAIARNAREPDDV